MKKPAGAIVKLRLTTPDGRQMPAWTPGSHIDVECGTPDVTRQYSLCGDPADANALEIAVLREADGRGGSALIHDEVRAGNRLKIRGPRNHFRLDESLEKVIFIAGGIGITPISAMARRAKALGMDYSVHYSGRKQSCMALLDDLAKLHGERLHVYVSDEGQRNDLPALLVNPVPGAKVYACGPVRMLQAVEACCAAWPEDSLRFEHFVSTADKLDPSKEHAFEVELKDSGIVLTIPPDRTVMCAENLDPGVVMMKSAEYRVRTDDSSALNRARDRRIFIQ
jgi:ferredoxin-NADP reductase